MKNNMKAHFGYYSRRTHAKLEKLKFFRTLQETHISNAVYNMDVKAYLDHFDRTGILLPLKTDNPYKDCIMGREDLLGPGKWDGSKWIPKNNSR